MNVFETIVIAIVEGLTDFLPVSSTGHMIIAQNLMGVESTDFVKAFTFIIQFGAILSVLVLYWKRFFQLNRTPMPEGTPAVKRFLHKYDFYWKLFIAFIPAAVFGLLFSDAIDSMLERVEVVAVTLILGGVFMIFCAIMGHGVFLYQQAQAAGQFSFPVLFYLIVFAVIMVLGWALNLKNKKRAEDLKSPAVKQKIKRPY